MADITLGELKAYADANGMSGAIDEVNGTIDLAALTGDTVDANYGVAEPLVKLLTASRATAVANDKALQTYSAITNSIQPADGTNPARVLSSATLTVVLRLALTMRLLSKLNRL